MKYVILILMLMMVGCAKDTERAAFPSCSARISNGQKEVVCSDGSTFNVTDGTNGVAGSNGSDGSNGYSTGALIQAATANQCSAGGTQVSFYKDYNSDGYLNGDDEVTSQFLVCNGVAGAAGASGTNGTNGTNGSNGTNGTSSTVSVTAANHTQCPTGGLAVTTTNGVASSTNVVCNGATGPVGATGATGSQGPSGYDLDNLSMVQLCPGTVTYPSKFIEYAACFNGQLYGVYSENDGFWALLPPGAYTSNGINASCNFSIGANCQISH